MNFFKYFLFTIEFYLCFNFGDTKKQRKKRFLIVPPTAPTRHQLIAGIGIPLPDLDYESLITGWVLKGQYFLPISADNLYPTIFYPEKYVNFRKRDIHNSSSDRFVIDPITGEKYERYSVEATDIETKSLVERIDQNNSENDDDDEWDDDDDEDDDESYVPLTTEKVGAPPIKLENSRWSLYKGLEAISEKNGFEGRSCVLRSICEAAEASFTHKSGILGELLHVVFSPSTTKEKLSKHSDNEYLKAEQIGRSGDPCEQIFNECSSSLLDIFSGVHDPLEELSNFF